MSLVFKNLKLSSKNLNNGQKDKRKKRMIVFQVKIQQDSFHWSIWSCTAKIEKIMYLKQNKKQPFYCVTYF